MDRKNKKLLAIGELLSSCDDIRFLCYKVYMSFPPFLPLLQPYQKCAAMFYQGYCDWCTLSIENVSHTIQGDLTALSNQTTPTTQPTVSSWIERSETCTSSIKLVWE